MLNRASILKSCIFKAVRSSGSGGQHVNKVSTKVEIHFNIEHALGLSEEQKNTIILKLAYKLTKDKNLVITCQDTRSQKRNKDIAIYKLLQLLERTLQKDKKRIPTKIPKSVKIKRLKSKRVNSERKFNRRKPDLD